VIERSSGFSFLAPMSKWAILLLSLTSAFSISGQVDPVLLGPLPAAIDEASGLYCSSIDTCWTHNDDTDGARIYALSGSGAFLEQRFISDAEQFDYESISGGPGDWLIGDFGNNGNERTDLTIYRFTDPRTTEDDILPSTSISFHMEDQTAFPPAPSQWNFDLEAMVHTESDILLFTRNRTTPYNGITKVYRLNTDEAEQTAMLIGSFLTSGTNPSSAITGAALDTDEDRLALCSAEGLYVYDSFHVDETDFNDYEFIPFISSRSYEGIDWVDGCTVRLITEGALDGSLYELDLCTIGLEEEGSEGTPIEIVDGLIYYSGTNDIDLTLYGLDGRQLRTSFNGILSTSGLPSGIYLLRINASSSQRCITIFQP
jgi:hypothetical protein